MISRFFGRVLSFFKGLWGYALRHKVQAGVFILLIGLLVYGGYSSYKKNVTTTQYVLAMVRNAPIEETVTGSGQVASEHQLNLSPKASGALTSVRVKAGDQVAAGTLIATVDSTDAQKSLRDATTNLASARISYAQSQTSNSGSVQKSTDSAFTTNATAYTDMFTVLNGINTIMQGNEVSGSYATKNVYAYSKLFNDNSDVVAYRDRALASYASAYSAYQSAAALYASASRSDNPETIKELTATTYQTAQSVAQAAKDLNDYLALVNQRFTANDSSRPSILTTHQSSSLSYLSTMNGDVSALQNAANDLTTTLQTAGNGSETLTQQSAQLSLQKAENSYQDALDTLANYSVRAPFPGTIASVPLQKFDQTGSGTTVAVLVTKQQLATLTLNEVDAAKVRSGQKAVLTFDAIDGLSIDGSVAEVDTVGTVSQGVVSYTVKIGFDTQDPRILSGMTVNATIVTASKDSALVIPTSAIKAAGTESYVEVVKYAPPGGTALDTASSTRRFRSATSTTATGTQRTFTGPTVEAKSVTTRRVNVTMGITSATMTEITTGLTPGEFVVSSSLNASGATTQTRSIFNLFGGGGARAGATGAARTTGTGAARPTGGNATFTARPAN